jgi:hypothetical protein
MYKSKRQRLIRKLVILVVLVAGLGVTAFSPPDGEASCLPCCSACFSCYDECDLKQDPVQQESCYDGCNALCRHGCNPGC